MYWFLYVSKSLNIEVLSQELETTIVMNTDLDSKLDFYCYIIS